VEWLILLINSFLKTDVFSIVGSQMFYNANIIRDTSVNVRA